MEEQGLVPVLKETFAPRNEYYNIPQIDELFAQQGLGAASGGAIFTVEATDDNYEEVGVNAVITDIRLIGKTGYPVYTTQTNVEFRKADLTYDSTNGKLTIPNFNLQTDEHITIFAIGAQDPSNFGSVLTDIEMLKQVIAPIIDGSTIQIWRETDMTKSPPPGYEEVTAEYVNRFLMGADPADPDSSGAGDIGGSSHITLTNANMPSGVRIGGEGSTYDEALGTGDTRKHTSAGAATAIDITPEFKRVRYIRWVGII